MDNFEELRKRAEERVQPKHVDINTLTPNEIRSLIHNLEVHQVELEMQNAQLQVTQNYLEESKNKYFDLFEFAPVGYLILDYNLVIQKVNSTFCSLMGCVKDVAIKRNFTNYISPDFQDEFYHCYREVVKNSSAKGIDIKLLAEGKEKWFRIELKTTDDGHTFILSLNNIHELKSTERKLDKALIELNAKNDELHEVNALKDKIFSIIGHDLKSPITNIIGFSNLIEQNFEKYTEEKIKNFNKLIFRSSEIVLQILENLLVWSRSQRNKIEYHPQRANVRELVNDTIHLLKPSSELKKVELKNEVPIEHYAFFDPQIMSTVMRNLVSNAIKFSNPKQSVTIISRDDRTHITVSVIDEGVGIPAHKIDSIFELNSDSSSVGTAGEKGTGLGLIITKEFVELNHGRILVKSKEGKGTTFEFTLPVTPSNS